MQGAAAIPQVRARWSATGGRDKYVSYRKSRQNLVIMNFGCGEEGGGRVGLHMKCTELPLSEKKKITVLEHDRNC